MLLPRGWGWGGGGGRGGRDLLPRGSWCLETRIPAWSWSAATGSRSTGCPTLEPLFPNEMDKKREIIRKRRFNFDEIGVGNCDHEPANAALATKHFIFVANGRPAFLQKCGCSVFTVSLMSGALTLSLPRVINFKFPLQPHQKYCTTQYEERGFSYSFLRWKMIILVYRFSLPHLYTSK